MLPLSARFTVNSVLYVWEVIGFGGALINLSVGNRETQMGHMLHLQHGTHSTIARSLMSPWYMIGLLYISLKK